MSISLMIVAAVLAGMPPSASSKSELLAISHIQSWDQLVVEIEGVSDIVYDPTRDALFLSLSSQHPDYPNTVAAYDYRTGVLEPSAFIGSEPAKLALSSDGTALYTALEGAQKVVRIDPATLAVVYEVPLNALAVDIAVSPSDPDVLAVAQDDRYVQVFDGTAARTDRDCCAELLTFGDTDTELYAVENNDLFTFTVDADGLAPDGEFYDVVGTVGTYGTIAWDDGTVIVSNGRVLNPTTGATLRTFQDGAMAIDSVLDRVYSAYEPANDFRFAESVLSTGEYLGVQLLPDVSEFSAITVTALGGFGVAALVDASPRQLVMLGDFGIAALSGKVTDVTGTTGADYVQIYNSDFEFVTEVRIDRSSGTYATTLLPGTYHLAVSPNGGFGGWYPGVGDLRPDLAEPVVVDPGASVVANITLPARFGDVNSKTGFQEEVDFLVRASITSGCEPSRFCPYDPVTRAQMASFLARALRLPATSTDYFEDDAGSPHEANINALREADITLGCSSDGARYCPGEQVSRAQMASFLVRALDLTASSTDYFGDDSGSPHESNINALRASEVTLGCTDTEYCPNDPAIRIHMAAFLFRGLADRFPPEVP